LTGRHVGILATKTMKFQLHSTVHFNADCTYV
jgi:hypothetical protein